MARNQQKVVRTYSGECADPTTEMNEALKDGYIVKHITPFVFNGNTEYIEYIVEKRVSEPFSIPSACGENCKCDKE